MIVHYPFLVLSLILLCFPRNWLRYGKRLGGVRVRQGGAQAAEQEFPQGRNPVKLLAEAAKSKNWVDLLRAATGAWGITHMALTPEADSLFAGRLEWVVQGGILLAAVLAQMVRWEGRMALFAPIFFLQGLTIGVAGPLVGVIAMAGSWALSPVLPGPGSLLFVQGGSSLILGLLLEDHSPRLMLILACLVWLPTLASLLLHKRLSVSFDKRGRGPGSRERRSRRGRVASDADADNEVGEG